jgi:hypothetical protein
MEATLAKSGWSIDAGSTISLVDARDWTIVFEHGSAWLTLEGYSQDKLLRAGDRFTVPSAGLMLVEATSASGLRLEPPAAGALSRISATLSAQLVAIFRRMLNALSGATLHSNEHRSAC